MVDDCRHDLAAWLDWLRQRLGPRSGLLGHSLGAVKSLYAAAREPEPAPACVVALSPPRLSYSGFCSSPEGPQFQETYAQARRHIEAAQPETLMEVRLPLPFVTTAGGYAEKYGPDGTTTTSVSRPACLAPRWLRSAGPRWKTIWPSAGRRTNCGRSRSGTDECGPPSWRGRTTSTAQRGRTRVPRDRLAARAGRLESERRLQSMSRIRISREWDGIRRNYDATSRFHEGGFGRRRNSGGGGRPAEWSGRPRGGAGRQTGKDGATEGRSPRRHALSPPGPDRRRGLRPWRRRLSHRRPEG